MGASLRKEAGYRWMLSQRIQAIFQIFHDASFHFWTPVYYDVPYIFFMKLEYRCILIRVCEEEEGGVTAPKLSFGISF